MAHLPALLCVLFLIGLLWAETGDRLVAKAVFKTAASLSFIAYGITMGALDAGAAGAAIIVALVLSAVGDVALLSKERGPFLGGLVAFLLAHVAYVFAFLMIGVDRIALVVSIAVLFLPALAVWRWLRSGVGRLGGPVMVYIAVISVMVAAAIGSLADLQPGFASGRTGLMAGAVTFYLSDLCVARERFVTSDLRNRLVGLPLYYVAQLIFGYSISAWAGT